MQTECPHRRFCRLDAIRDELSPQAAERFDKLVLPPKSPKHSGCVERANAVSRYEFHQSCAGELSVGTLNVELARFELLCNAYRPHQALGQRTPMQAL